MCIPVLDSYTKEETELINKIPVKKNNKLGQNEIRKGIWIVESGASSLMTNGLCGLINQKK